METQHVGQRLSLVAGSDAGIARGIDIVEIAKARGRYGFACVGPIESKRALYNEIAEELHALSKQNPLQRFIARPRVGFLQRELGIITLEPKWDDKIDNVVTTQGGNDLLDKYLAGSSYTAAFFLGLISSVSYTTGVQIGDTAAQINGTNAWKEANTASNFPLVSQGTRVAPSWGAAASKTKATNANMVFSIITTGGTVKGGFLVTTSTFGGTTGVLFSGGTFTGGDKIVSPGDTLNGTYSLGV